LASEVVLSAAIVIALVVATVHAQTAPSTPRPAAVRPSPAAGQVPRTADGKPDFSGIWQALNTAAWDLQDHNSSLASHLGVPPGRGVVEGNEIPYKPEALEQKKQRILIIRADEDAAYSSVMQAMDELRAAGLEDIGLITERRTQGPGGGGE